MTEPHPVECDKTNCHRNAVICHLNGRDARYWVDAYDRKSKEWSLEVDRCEMLKSHTCYLNMEVEKLREAIRTFSEVFDAIYEFDERRFNQLKITKDKIEAFKTKYVC